MKKDLIVQLEASKLSIKDLLSDLLNETKGFKNQFTVNVLLKKYKLNGEIEFAPVYFNSTTETVINHRFKLETSFQDILYLKNNWINEGSCWIVEPIESQYINISTYRSLSGSSYIRLPEEFKNPRKRLISFLSSFLVMSRLGLWLKTRFIAMSMVFWSGILVNRLVTLQEAINVSERFAFLILETK